MITPLTFKHQCTMHRIGMTFCDKEQCSNSNIQRKNTKQKKMIYLFIHILSLQSIFIENIYLRCSASKVTCIRINLSIGYL